MNRLVKIRDATAADLKFIVDIYNQSIPGKMATADTEEIAVESKLNWYRDRSPHRPLWVATQAESVVGWLSFQNFYGRPAYLHTAEVSLYVATDRHRQGIGSCLLARAIAHSSQLQLTTLLAFVFAHNEPSINLFTRYGFSQWGYLPDVAVLDNYQRSLIILGKSLG